MKLPFFTKSKKVDTSYYLTLLFQDEKIIAAILKENVGELTLFSAGESPLATPLETATLEQMLEATDKAVSQAEQTLPVEIPTHRTIFGVYTSWTEDGHITKDRLTMLKQICEELSLNPIGFLVYTEAIIHLLQKEEGAPISAIIVEKDKNTMRASLVRAGRILESKVVPLEDNLPELVDKTLGVFISAEVLPSRIVLFDGANNEQTSQSFLNHHWSKTLPFLHMPQVTILPPNFDLKGILYGTATQLGLHMGKSTLDTIKLIPTIPPLEEFGEEVKQNIQVPMTNDQQDDNRHSGEEQTVTTPESDGSWTSQDDELKHTDDERTTNNELRTTDHIDTHVLPEAAGADFFGFVKDKDVATEHTRAIPRVDNFTSAQQLTESLPEIAREEETDYGQADNFTTESGMMLRNAGQSTQVLFATMGRGIISMLSRMITGSSIGRTIGIGVGAVILLGVALFIAYTNMLHGTITLIFTPQPLTKDIPATFSTSGGDNAITVTQISTENTVTDNIAVTGTKDVGTPAKGTISIFSRSTDPVTLPKGTKVISSNNLSFTLDASTPIASFSGGPDDPSLVVNNVAVTAGDIGTDYNIPAGTKFTVSGQDKAYIGAKNDSAFSGGTKQSLTVVSTDDMTNLTNQILTKAKSQASPNLSSKDAGKTIIQESVQQTVTNKNFSQKIGDQAKSLSLTATVQTTALAYAQADIMSFVTHQLDSAHGSDTQIAPNSIVTKLSNVTKKNDTVTATINASASLLPTVNASDITQKIAGKSYADAVTYLKTLPQLQDATLKLSPAIPFLPQRLPMKAGNITVLVKSS